MFNDYDFLLITLSMLVASLSAHYACNFIRRLYIATPTQRITLLPIYSCTIGAVLFCLNNLNWVAMHPINGDSLSIPMLFGSMFASMFAAYNVFSASTEKQISFSTLVNKAIITSLMCYTMFYLSFSSRHSAETISVNVEQLFLSILAGAVVCALVLLYYFKLKLIPEKSAKTVSALLALVLGVLITGLYAIYNTTLLIQGQVSSEAEHLVNNRETIASIMSISIASLFAVSFIAPKYYEKLYQTATQLFSKFSLNDGNANDVNAKDGLTQLANRRGFEAQLNSAVKRSTRMGKTIALAYIDLDHFKPINDNFGHHVGDAVLVAVAQRLNKTVRACDFVARLGGDEFVAIIEDITFDEDITPIIGRVVDSIKEPFHVEEHNIDISCSVGVAVYPGDGNIEKLMVCADAAMYKAKENGKNQFKFFDAEIELASEQMLEMHRDLRQAIDNNEFVLLFQPKVDCKTQQPVGAEALIRWNHPTKGLLQPGEFLPAAERFGLVNYMNDWVLEEACRTIYRAKTVGVVLNLN
jgi:diguanylate cyclase